MVSSDQVASPILLQYKYNNKIACAYENVGIWNERSGNHFGPSQPNQANHSKRAIIRKRNNSRSELNDWNNFQPRPTILLAATESLYCSTISWFHLGPSWAEPCVDSGEGQIWSKFYNLTIAGSSGQKHGHCHSFHFVEYVYILWVKATRPCVLTDMMEGRRRYHGLSEKLQDRCSPVIQ